MASLVINSIVVLLSLLDGIERAHEGAGFQKWNAGGAMPVANLYGLSVGEAGNIMTGQFCRGAKGGRAPLGGFMAFARALTCVLVLIFCTSFLHAQSKPETLNLTFTTIDVPGAMLTVVSGINKAGDMVGWYVPVGGQTGSGFLLSGGKFTYLDYPGGYDTTARAINDSGLVVGYAYVSSEGAVGFTYQAGAYRTIQIPGYPDTFAQGINNNGYVVGGYGYGSTQGFEQFGGKLKNITPPGSYAGVSANSINALGQITGSTNLTNTEGFLYQRGKYQKVSVPGSEYYTVPLAINDWGIVAGWYFGCTSTCTEHGFVLMKGRYLSFDYPGGMFTFAEGINNAGQIVGGYSLDGSTTHGFVTSPVSAVDLRDSR
jgi:probable HAF family extracellular repeat protein